MGACTFFNTSNKLNASEAFTEVHDIAVCEEGHGGYTGTIAEKDTYSMSQIVVGFDCKTWVDMIRDFDPNQKVTDQNIIYFYQLKNDYEIFNDKWGPALCVPLDDLGFLFCGFASY